MDDNFDRVKGQFKKPWPFILAGGLSVLLLTLFFVQQGAKKPEPVKATSCLAPPANMVHWWTADGTPNDAVGGNTATMNAATFTAGKVGQGFTFPAGAGPDDPKDESDTILVPLTPSMVPGSDSFTVEMWVQTSDRLKFGHPFIAFGDVGASQRYGIPSELGNWAFIIGDGSGSFKKLYKPNVDNVWAHVAGVIDRGAGQAYLYVDGVRVAQEDISTFGPIVPSFPTARIGAEDFRGIIDEVIYGKPKK